MVLIVYQIGQQKHETISNNENSNTGTRPARPIYEISHIPLLTSLLLLEEFFLMMQNNNNYIATYCMVL